MRSSLKIAEKKIRTRRCAVSGQSLCTEQLIRFVVAPDGRVAPDLAACLPGRGMWIGAQKSLVQTAISRRTFRRALKVPVSAPDTLCDQIVRLLQRRCLSLVGLAHRSGMLIIGGSKCTKCLDRDAEPTCLIIASDACPKTSGSLGRAWTRRFASRPVVVSAFSKDQLGRALGRRAVAYAMLPRCSLAEKFMIDVIRLAGFDPDRPHHPIRT